MTNREQLIAMHHESYRRIWGSDLWALRDHVLNPLSYGQCYSWERISTPLIVTIFCAMEHCQVVVVFGPIIEAEAIWRWTDHMALWTEEIYGEIRLIRYFPFPWLKSRVSTNRLDESIEGYDGQLWSLLFVLSPPVHSNGLGTCAFVRLDSVGRVIF